MAPGVEARSIGPVVVPCAFKGWLARVGPPLGVLGRGCYKVFNARLVSYRYPTSKWMSDCRSQRIAGEWRLGRSVPWLPLALGVQRPDQCSLRRHFAGDAGEGNREDGMVCMHPDEHLCRVPELSTDVSARSV